MNSDFPCECGHPQSDHIEIVEAMVFWCQGCGSDDIEHSYKPDNLKFLENKSEQNH